MKILIPHNLLQSIHDYLTTRPMREVEALVHGIRTECAEPTAEKSDTLAKKEFVE